MALSGKNQKELAKIIGVSPASFNRWIKCDLFPRIDKIQKLADYFGIAKSDLIEDKSQVGNPDKADLHVKILMDTEVLQMLEVYYELSESDKQALRLMAYALRTKNGD